MVYFFEMGENIYDSFSYFIIKCYIVRIIFRNFVIKWCVECEWIIYYLLENWVIMCIFKNKLFKIVLI